MRCTQLMIWAVMIPASLLLGFSPAWAATAPILGDAERFAVMAGTTVTNTGPSVITGHLGVSPGTAVTGFPPGTVLDGSIHSNDALTQQAQLDLTTAYNDLAGQAFDADLSGQDLGGLTLGAGVYRFGSSAALTGTLTLDAAGDPDAVFIFQMGSTLTTAASSQVRVVNGGSKCNVFWQVGSSATLGAATSFIGNVVALTSITLSTDGAVTGRVLARNGAVTLGINTVTVCPINGSSNGDPHLRTFDGLAYDFQATGDFVLASRPSQAFEVQVRQEPWGDSGRIAVNTAVAVRAGPHTVSIAVAACAWDSDYPEGCVQVDGHAAEFGCIPDPQQPGCGRSVLLAGVGRLDETLPAHVPTHRSVFPQKPALVCRVKYTLKLVNGEKVVACILGRHMNVSVELPPTGRILTMGLLGNADADPTNDLQLRGGPTLPLTPSPYFDVFYRGYGESWRVSAEESLFATALEQAPGGPSGPFLLEELCSELREHAGQICRGVGVHPSVLDDCVLDVAMMGDDSALEFIGIGAPRAVLLLRVREPCGAFAGEDCVARGVVAPDCACELAGGSPSISPFALLLFGFFLVARRRGAGRSRALLAVSCRTSPPRKG